MRRSSLKYRLYVFFKRLIDVIVSVFALIFLLPIVALLMFCIWWSDGFPLVYFAKRVGKNKKKFFAYKIRTLNKETSYNKKRRDSGLGHTNDAVINRVAQIMRDTHLDELLQFINILKGDMTLIGPRPLDEPRYKYLVSRDERWDQIFKVKQGLTCINQLARYSENGLEKVRKLKGLRTVDKRNRLDLDRYYIRHESFVLDFKILLWTFEYLFFGFFKKVFK